jgi:hypothetical protein
MVGKKKMSPKPTAEYLGWLVKSRYLNQSACAKLYELIQSNSRCWSSDLGYDVKTLISIGFSLWRAAFLADKTGHLTETNDHSMVFFGEMLETNAIAFVQDKKARGFTFNYYLANVRFRLAEYKTDHESFHVDQRLLSRGKLAREKPRKRWELYQAAFSDAVEHFEKRSKSAGKR